MDFFYPWISLAGFFPFLHSFFGNQSCLCFASKCMGHWSSYHPVQDSHGCSAAFFTLCCSLVSTGPEFLGLVRVALRGRNLSSFYPSGAVAGGGVGAFSPLTGRGSEVDLVMVTCTRSWFLGVPGVELCDGDAGIFQVFCGVPGLVVFGRVTGALGTALEVVSVLGSDRPAKH